MIFDQSPSAVVFFPASVYCLKPSPEFGPLEFVMALSYNSVSLTSGVRGHKYSLNWHYSRPSVLRIVFHFRHIGLHLHYALAHPLQCIETKKTRLYMSILNAGNV